MQNQYRPIGSKKLMSRKILSSSFVVLLLAAIFCSGPAIASVEGPPKPGYVGVEFTDLTYETTSYLIPESVKDDDHPTTDPTCASVSDKKCDGKSVRFNAVMPVCVNDSDINCIASVEAVDVSGKRFPASMNGYFPSESKTAFAGDPKLHLPSGAASSLWSLPAAAHCGGTNYALSFSANGSYQMGDTRIQKNDAVAHISNLQIRLSPINIVSGSVTDIGKASGIGADCGAPNQGIWLCDKDGWSNGNAYNSSLTPDWANFHTDSGTCAVKYPFPEGFRFRVVVRTNLLTTGWLHGRLADPRVKITQVSNSSIIDVEAAPLIVSSVVAFTPWKDLPAAEQATYDSRGSFRCPNGNALGNRGDLGPDPATRSTITQASSSGECSMLLLQTWFSHIADKATDSNSVWSLRNLGADSQVDSDSNAGMDACFNDSSSVAGLVTTNSTTYLAGPPVFNKADGVLTYKVSSPHLQPDGSIFKGIYNLALRSDVARCIYKFTSAPLSASIEVVSENGSQQVATTSMSEKDGWIYLSASGFTYSSPTVKVKLVQSKVEVPVEPAPTALAPAASPQVAAAKKSITCMKGKTVKKVTAVNPKCPVGYKKK